MPPWIFIEPLQGSGIQSCPDPGWRLAPRGLPWALVSNPVGVPPTLPALRLILRRSHALVLELVRLALSFARGLLPGCEIGRVIREKEG